MKLTRNSIEFHSIYWFYITEIKLKQNNVWHLIFVKVYITRIYVKWSLSTDLNMMSSIV